MFVIFLFFIILLLLTKVLKLNSTQPITLIHQINIDIFNRE